MTARPANPCTTPGCAGRAETGRCARCRGRQARTAPDRPQAAGAYGHEWRARRITYLTDNPYCVICTHLAQVPDHYPLSRRTLVAMGVHDPDADEYLRALCKRCHDRQTAVHQPGGWHRDRTRWDH